MDESGNGPRMCIIFKLICIYNYNRFKSYYIIRSNVFILYYISFLNSYHVSSRTDTTEEKISHSRKHNLATQIQAHMKKYNNHLYNLLHLSLKRQVTKLN